MEDVILQLLDGFDASAGSNMALLNKVFDCIKTFREEAVCIDPTPYNNFLPLLKQLVSGKSITQLWDTIKQGNSKFFFL